MDQKGKIRSSSPRMMCLIQIMDAFETLFSRAIPRVLCPYFAILPMKGQAGSAIFLNSKTKIWMGMKIKALRSWWDFAARYLHIIYSCLFLPNHLYRQVKSPKSPSILLVQLPPSYLSLRTWKDHASICKHTSKGWGRTCWELDRWQCKFSLILLNIWKWSVSQLLNILRGHF